MQKAKELESRIKGFAERLAAQTDRVKSSDELLAYLKFAANFHSYSFNNTILIMLQRQDATRVAGYKTWQKLGRQVRKGEAGISILAPMKIKAKRKDEATGDEVETGETYTRFRMVHVFDVSQTDGDDLPQMQVLSGADCSTQLTAALLNFAASKNIVVETAEMAGSTYGASFSGRVEISEALNSADHFSVLVHELAHELLDHHARTLDKNRQSREIEAETVAYVVCEHFQIESTAPNYLALYQAEGQQVLAHLSGLVGTIQTIINGIETNLNKEENDEQRID